MSGDLRLSSLQRESVAPRAASAADNSAAIAIDDKTFWTGGKEYQLDVTNQHPFRRWYRVMVTNLKPVEEYCVYYRVIRSDRAMEETFSRYSQFDALSNEDMIEVAQGEVLQFWLVLGGDANTDATAVRTFDVVVQEFAVPEERALQGELWREALRWIPRPNLQQVELKVLPAKVKQAPAFLAKLLPWRRTKPCLLQLDNYSSLPVTAAFRVDPSEENKEIGVAGIRSTMQQPLPPGQRHREECRVLITEALKKPVFLDIAADVRLANDPASENLARPKAIEIIPIPWLQCWEVYLSALVGLFCAVWLVFGMPPWSETEVKITLVLENLPKTVTDHDLEVKLRLVGNDPPFGPKLGTPGKRDGNRLPFTFRWPAALNGPRWTWSKSYELELEPKARTGAKEFVHYKLNKTYIDGAYTLGRGFKLDNHDVTFQYESRLATIIIPSCTPPTPFSYEVIEDSGKTTKSDSPNGDGVKVQIDVPTEDATVSVKITPRNKPGLYHSEPVTLKPGDNKTIAWTVEKKDPDGATGHTIPTVPLTVNPLNGTPGTGGANGGSGGLAGSNGGSTLPIVINQGDGKSGGDIPGTHQNGPTPPAGLPQEQVDRWCNALGILNSSAGLVSGSKSPGALKVTNLHIVPGDDKSFTVVISPTKDSYVQVYEIYPHADPHPVFGIDLKTRMAMSPGSPGVVARPILMPANKPYELDLQADGPTARIIVIAYHTDQAPTEDLVEILGQKASEPALKDWTIGQVVYNVK